jgi:hypothetical protein
MFCSGVERDDLYPKPPGHRYVNIFLFIYRDRSTTATALLRSVASSAALVIPCISKKVSVTVHNSFVNVEGVLFCKLSHSN